MRDEDSGRPGEPAGAAPDGRTNVVALDLGGRGAARRSGRSVVVGGVAFGVACGLLAGFLGGWLPALVAGVVLGAPLVLLGVGEWRRHLWLDGTTVCQRGLGVRRVDIATAQRMEVVVAELRRRRTIGMLLAGPPSNKAVSVRLATYSGEAGAELDILALRRLADAFASAPHSSGLVHAELLVAQLRAEARGEGIEGRPLYQLSGAVPAGRVPHRIGADKLVSFVSGLP